MVDGMGYEIIQWGRGSERGQRCSELGHDVGLRKLASLNASPASKVDVRPFGLSWGPKWVSFTSQALTGRQRESAGG